MSFTLCTSGAAAAKAGVNVNSDVLGDSTILATWSDETEGYINAETRRDWITEAPNSATSGALADVASSHIANKMVNYDMNGYTSREEAQTILDVNADIARRGISFLSKQEVKENM